VWGLKFNPNPKPKPKSENHALVTFMEESHPHPAGLLDELRGMPVPKP